MSEERRLPPQPGEWIDRNRPIGFEFEGRPHSGFAGDTFSSALAASGVKMLGRSFKYHRPRGVYSLANHDCNAMMQNEQHVNLRGDVTPLWEGAQLRAVNTFGGLQADRYQIMDRLSRFLPVGFYYKTFHRPRALFPFWERRMREAAGLGQVNVKSPRVRTPKDYDFCDVLVIGAGPAGLSAAIAAGQAGASVTLVDENPRLGGSFTYQWRGQPDAVAKGDELLHTLAGLPNIKVRLSTVAAGYYADHWVGLVDERRLTKMRARAVVVATGAFEQPAVFRHNDLPGVMLASAAQRLVRWYAVKPFDRALVLTANGDGYRTAQDLLGCGVEIAAVVDMRADGDDGSAAAALTAAGVAIHKGYAVYEARPRGGNLGIRGATIRPLDAAGALDKGKGLDIRCDGIAMSVGYSAADNLVCQAGGRMAYSTQVEQFIPQKLPEGLFTAGRVNGIYQLGGQLEDGRAAGLASARYLGISRESAEPPARPPLPARSPSHPYPIVAHKGGKNFVDLDEDVQVKDLVNAAQEGFDHVELLKRYSTFGMGPSQGKLTNVNVLRVLAKIKGQTVAATGTTTSRPFFHPVPLGHLAGRGFAPHRHTTLHHRHDERGAVYLYAGEWMRPAYYPIAGGTREDAITSEVATVRRGLGLIDVGTLGKITIAGRDAAAFIERIYTARFANMKVGTSRYALMCDESGVIIDDGVVVRRAPERFYVTTTTTASGGVYREMQRWAQIWGMNVVLTNDTGHYGAMNLAGPASRQVLERLTAMDLGDAAFPYLAAREGEILGVPALAMRVGFVGELGYEIHVPSQLAVRVWDGLMEAGKSVGIRPFGVEAQRVLRLEKGHAIISQDTDGLTTPREAGMLWAVKDDKPFFVGQRSLRVMGTKMLERQLVGFTIPLGGPVPKECHLVIEGNKIVGRVTSVAVSPTLNQVIGLAYVHPSQARPGSVVHIRTDAGAMVAGRVTPVPFYDPKNARQKPPTVQGSAAA